MFRHFLKHAQRFDPAQPILLLLHGQITHTSLHMVHWAMEHNIHLIVLPAHTSHITQLLDVPFSDLLSATCTTSAAEYAKKTTTNYNEVSNHQHGMHGLS